MKEFEEEIWAYSLQNAIEFGKADASKILPKLFQHGLDKKDIGKVRETITEIVGKVNSLSEKERIVELKKYEDIVVKREYPERSLPELPESDVGIDKVFRLAPFPSGALHIGHAKTYLLNALYAEKYNGDIIFVIDDTIGSKEKTPIKRGYELIKEAFDWLGVKYRKPIVYKSDRLKIYYKYAEELINKGRAYVCECNVNEMRDNRANGKECRCRSIPKGLQNEKWEDMFSMKEGEATLRIKTNMQHPNPAFRDRVLFKISDREHPRVGKKFRVWPSLEMSWAIDDHELGITHIIRGNELMMETEMEKFIWDIFRWKHPVAIHTGLVKLEGIVGKISKSKARKEVESGEYIGWDDPRAWSIQSLKRRGIKPGAIKDFIEEIGLNKQNITVPIDALYAINRKIIDSNAMRYSFVRLPIKIKIIGEMPFNEIEIPVHPDMPDKKRKVNIGREIFVSSNDFEKYKNQEIRLLHLFNLILNEKANVIGTDVKNIPKINWVSNSVAARILFPDGRWVEGIADESVTKLNIDDVLQFERFGFVRFDGLREGKYEFWFTHG